MYAIINNGKGKKMKGRVKWWSNEKGYGFIEYNENQSIFAHLENDDKQKYQIEEDQEIEFTIIEKNSSIFLKLTPRENKGLV